MLTLHLHAQLETTPEGLVECTPANSAAATVVAKKLEGVWYRVFPESATDILRLSYLDHHIDKYCPAHGEGILVSMRAMRSLRPV